MQTTPRWGTRTPDLTADSPDVPLWMRSMAMDLDDVAKDDQGVLADRPISTAASPGKAGRFYYATDTGQQFRDMGTGWVELATTPLTPEQAGDDLAAQAGLNSADSSVVRRASIYDPVQRASASRGWVDLGGCSLSVTVPGDAMLVVAFQQYGYGNTGGSPPQTALGVNGGIVDTSTYSTYGGNTFWRWGYISMNYPCTAGTWTITPYVLVVAADGQTYYVQQRRMTVVALAM